MSSEWNQDKGSWKISKPLGKAAEGFIFENPDYVVYLRKRQNDPCPIHYDYATGSENGLRLEGEPCPICWGTGKKVIPLIVPIRIFQGHAMGMNVNKTEPGYTENWDFVGYLPRKIKPTYEDIIFFVEWNVPVWSVPTDQRRRIVSVTDVVQIKATIDRFEKEVAFMAVDLRSYNIEHSILGRNLPLMLNIPVFQLEDWNRTTYW